jgi:huntingtin
LFKLEAALSFILGEFLRQISIGPHPELVALVISELFAIARDNYDQAAVIHWIQICLSTFVQMQPTEHGLWALTCLFLSSSTNWNHRVLFKEIARSVTLDEELFLIAATDFYRNQKLEKGAQDAICTAFRQKGHPLLLYFCSECEKSENK